MSSPRRLSTGGLPPIKIRETYVIEDAPSHDGTPCVTAWVRDEIVEVPRGWSASDFSISKNRPQWSLQIYDTTPLATDRDHLRSLAEMLHKETLEERCQYDRGQRDRIDVWGLPLPADTADDVRIAKCKAHILAEIASRPTENDDFHVQALTHHYKWKRAIVIIDRPEERWDEDIGGFLVVYWDMRPEFLGQLVREYGEDHEEPETSTFRYTRSDLGQALSHIREFF